MSKPLPTRAEIVACFKGQKRGMNPREIRSRCQVPAESFDRLIELLDQLCADGTLQTSGGHRYRVAKKPRGQSTELWEGRLGVNPRGFGFVTAVGHEDVYIPAHAIGAAFHGDLVSVSISSRSARGAEGSIAEIVERRSPRVAGVLCKRRKSAWLEPDDARVRGPITVIAGVGGNDGDAAVVSITRFPETADENAEGEVVAVLGRPGDANAEVAKILVREQIEEEHPPEALREAEAMAAKLAKLPLGKRKDLREVPFLTIDPVDARDHDDAVYAEKLADGFRVWIAIADVSEYVQAGTALDQEALSRGCTIYLPDRAIPMLPGALAADLCSLLPDTERYCMAVVADLDKKGKVKRFEVVEGLMVAAAMVSYGGVARALGFSDKPRPSRLAERFKKELKVLDDVSRKLRRSRFARGALGFDLPEPQLVLDEKTGAALDVKRRAEDPGVKRTYEIVEELMILANELVAQWMSKKRCPAIYRVHGKPKEEKLERLGEIAHILSAPFDLDEMSDPLGLSRWLKEIEDHKGRFVLEMMLLRSMNQAAYEIANIGHFGLASDAYLHFTSPIRRYPDLIVHRAIKRLLRGEKPDTSASAVERLRAAATQASTRERAAMQVEREVMDLYRALLMRDRIGEFCEGVVTALVGGGMFVVLDDPFVDVFVRFESMGPDRYELSDDEFSVVGTRSGDSISLGDRVTVEIEDVAVLRRTVYARRVVHSTDEVAKPVLPAISAPRRGRKTVAGKSTRRPALGKASLSRVSGGSSRSTVARGSSPTASKSRTGKKNTTKKSKISKAGPAARRRK